MTDGDRRPVVVGIDETTESQAALGWAVEKARSAGVPLRVVTVDPAAPPPLELADSDAVASSAALRQRHDAAVEYAQGQLGRENVSARLTTGRPAKVLVAEARQAELLVVGSRVRSATSAIVMGSVGAATVAHAACPVVVVRISTEIAPADRIVVGIDGSHQSDAAVRFAFEQATERGVPVAVVHCWQPYGYVDPIRWEHGVLEAEQQRRQDWIRQNIAPLAKEFPDVEHTAELVEGHTSTELTERSRRASLVVVGSRGHGGFAGLLLGSVSQNLLHHARCTVAVVKARP
ncbi:MAG: universal stress protein [Streptosporangiales bacterium]|nr:universal stress protein [Streptosporangiales bacterium]